jgi:3-phosphoinositide dependent protein kinase-1
MDSGEADLETVYSSTSDFMVGDLIGEGSFGQVFLGKHKTSGTYVAMKVVDKISLRKRQFLLDAVLSEQRMLLKLRDCDRVVKLLASFHDEHYIYLVMECATGGDLNGAIRQGFSTHPQKWKHQIAPQLLKLLLEALEQIHSKGIVHADLKPANVLLRSNGIIQLADFGSAIDLSERKETGFSGGNFVPRGTAEYSCPEIIRGEQDVTVSADLWSYGCILFAMFTGKSLFQAPSEALVIQKVKSFAATYDWQETNFDFADDQVQNDWSWQNCLKDLLNPIPLNRLGYDDFVTSLSVVHKDGAVVYKSIRDSLSWDDTWLDHWNGLVLPEPDWWSSSRQSIMRDGSIGWMAFPL